MYLLFSVTLLHTLVKRDDFIAHFIIIIIIIIHFVWFCSHALNPLTKLLLLLLWLLYTHLKYHSSVCYCVNLTSCYPLILICIITIIIFLSNLILLLFIIAIIIIVHLCSSIIITFPFLYYNNKLWNLMNNWKEKECLISNE